MRTGGSIAADRVETLGELDAQASSSLTPKEADLFLELDGGEVGLAGRPDPFAHCSQPVRSCAARSDGEPLFCPPPD
jgi:hypothetical protein